MDFYLITLPFFINVCKQGVQFKMVFLQLRFHCSLLEVNFFSDQSVKQVTLCIWCVLTMQAYNFGMQTHLNSAFLHQVLCYMTFYTKSKNLSHNWFEQSQIITFHTSHILSKTLSFDISVKQYLKMYPFFISSKLLTSFDPQCMY